MLYYILTLRKPETYCGELQIFFIVFIFSAVSLLTVATGRPVHLCLHCMKNHGVNCSS